MDSVIQHMVPQRDYTYRPLQCSATVVKRSRWSLNSVPGAPEHDACHLYTTPQVVPALQGGSGVSLPISSLTVLGLLAARVCSYLRDRVVEEELRRSLLCQAEPQTKKDEGGLV